MPSGLLYGLEVCCSKYRELGKRILNRSKSGRKDALLVSFYSIKVKNLPKVTHMKPKPDSTLAELCYSAGTA